MLKCASLRIYSTNLHNQIGGVERGIYFLAESMSKAMTISIPMIVPHIPAIPQPRKAEPDIAAIAWNLDAVCSSRPKTRCLAGVIGTRTEPLDGWNCLGVGEEWLGTS